MTSPVSPMDALRRRRPEWSPWLDVVGQVQREIASSRWDSAVPALVTDREPSAPRLASVRVTLDGLVVSEFMDKLAASASALGTPAMATVPRALGPEADPEPVFLASICQQPEQLEKIASASGADVDALQAVAALLSVPFLHACNRRWASATQVWTEGYCAVCGSWPAFAEVRGIDRTRYLRCGRCGGEWYARILHCAYCRTTNHQDLVTLKPESPGAPGVVDACNRCGGYVKAFTRLQGCAPGAVMLEDLGSVDLDVAAIEQGYIRRAAPGYPFELTVKLIRDAECGIVASTS